MQIERVESTNCLSAMKRHYIEQATAPLDGMWLNGFVPTAIHYAIRGEGKVFGYFCVNADGYMLQFYVDASMQSRASEVIDSIFAAGGSTAGKIKGAFVSTAEPHYLSLCFDRFANFEVNARMYQFDRHLDNSTGADSVLLKLAESSQLPEAIDFAVESIGAPAEWLAGYYANLINRKELFGVWINGQLVATGESRRRDEYQTEYADVGFIVAKTHRSKGLGTQILKQLVAINETEGLQSICSTETTNIAAQKAIVNAGFYTNNRIVQFHA